MKRLLRQVLSHNIFLLIIGAVVFIIGLSKATKITENMDEMGYYLSTVKWIENGPTIPGVALLNGRMGINSAWHMSSTIFGFDFLYSGGAYDLNALLFCFIYLVGIRAGFRLYRSKSKSYYSDILLLSLLIFPFHGLIDSMDADYPSIFIGIFLIAEIIRRIECNEFYIWNSSLNLYLFVSLFLFTIKPFSVVYIIYPLCVSIHHLFNKNRKPFMILTTISLGYTLPWLYRNYLISGYIIYPMHVLDFFNPIWKLPYDYVCNISLVVAEYAKIEMIRSDYLYTGVKSLSIHEWIPTWLSNNWNLLIGKFVIFFLPLCALSTVIESVLLKSKSKLWYLKLALGVISLIWFLNFPAIRFGWAFVLAFVVLTVIGYFDFFKMPKRSLFSIVAIAVSLSLCRNIIKTYTILKNDSHIVFPVKSPQLNDYKTVETNFIYYQSNSEYCYDKLPCVPAHNPWKIYQKGKDIKEGFVLQGNSNQ